MLHDEDSGSQRWKPSGCACTAWRARWRAAIACLAIDSLRIACSIACALPSTTQRVASALVTGDAITVVARSAPASRCAWRSLGALT